MKRSRWLSFCARQGGVHRAPYIYWDRGESRLCSLIPSGQRGWGDAGDIFQTHFKTAVGLISNKTNMKDVKAYSGFPLKVCFCMHRCCMDETLFVSPDSCARSCCFLPSCQSVRSWRVGPNPTLRPDTLLHKPSVLCCPSTRAGCMDYWCLHRANKARTWQGHTSHTCCMIHLLPAADIFLSIAKIRWGFPLFMPQLSTFISPSSSSSSLISHSLPHSWHTCISDYARRVEVIPAWISILMGCPLCPCLLSVRFHGSERRRRGDADGEEEGREVRRWRSDVAGESHLSVIGTGGTNNWYGNHMSPVSVLLNL